MDPGRMRPRVQLALDSLSLEQAIALALRVWPTVDVVEAGTALIKREGMAVVRALRSAVPGRPLVADMKTFDSARLEVDLAIDAGADIVTVLGCAGDATIRAAVGAAHARNRLIVVDLVGGPVAELSGRVERAREIEAMGADFLGVHAEEDVEPRALPHALLGALKMAVSTPLVVAGGVTARNVGELLAYAPAVIVVGSSVVKANDPLAAAGALREALEQNAR